jgi:hypothetical protein
MADTANLNIILSQGNAVNEVNNIRKQNLELNQQYVVQHSDIKKKKEREEVRKSLSGKRIDVPDWKKHEQNKKRGGEEHEKIATSEEKDDESGRLIDIMV